MIENWLSYSEKVPCPYGHFRVFDVSEQVAPDEDILNYLGEQILSSYRNLDYLKKFYEHTSRAELIQYLENYVFPSEINTIVKNVKQGDFGEFLASLIVSYFLGLVVPLHKMRWKFNKDRSVFCTDMMSHNAGAKISELYYYEIKTRLNIGKETVNGVSNFVTVHAHNSLLKDETTPNEAIADFLSREHFENGNFDLAAQYNEIVKTPTNYKKNFELFIIVERSKFKDDILNALQNMPPSLKPLGVTIVLIDNLRQIVSDTFTHAVENCIAQVHPVAI